MRQAIKTCQKGTGAKRREKRAYLADVQVTTVGGQLGVVDVEHGGVDAIGRSDGLARVAGLDDMGVLAV